MADFRRFPLRPMDHYRIETTRMIMQAIHLDEMPGRGTKVPPFACVNRLLPSYKILSTARPDLYEHHRQAVPHDQIDLSLSYAVITP